MKDTEGRILRRCAALALLFVTVTASAQDDFGLGMNDTSPRLLEAMPRTAPSASYVEARGSGEDPLPGRVDLSDLMPTPGYQGSIGSCGAWATAYALRSYQENAERGWGADEDSEIFSPSFLYNLFSDGQDRGSHFPGLFALLEQRGCATLATMPYTQDVGVQPADEALAEAERYRIVSYSRLDPQNVEAIKAILAEGEPVVFGAMLYNDFLRYEDGVYVRRATREYGPHGMTLAGYDDARGAFLLINSWGTSWGDGGYAWMSYETFRETAFEAYTVQDRVDEPGRTAEPPAAVRASRGASADMVRVSWKPVGSPAFFEVYRADNGTGRFELLGTGRNAGYRDESALPGVEYLYAVKSVFVDQAGGRTRSAMSGVATGWRAEPEPDRVVPGTPGNLSARVAEGHVRISWSAVDGARGYRIYRFDDTSEEFEGLGETEEPGYADRSLEELPSGTGSVSYVVTAFNETGEGPATEVVMVSIDVPPGQLGSPEWIGVDERAGPGSQRLRWTPVTGAEAYRIEGFSASRDVWELETRVSETSWLRDELAERRTYRVVALAGERSGEPSYGVVMGSLPVTEFDDTAYRDAEWERRRQELGFTEGDDTTVAPGARRAYRGRWEDRDLFDFEEIQAFFEEARRAEEEAFRRYRQDEEEAFEEFLREEETR